MSSNSLARFDCQIAGYGSPVTDQQITDAVLQTTGGQRDSDGHCVEFRELRTGGYLMTHNSRLVGMMQVDRGSVTVSLAARHQKFVVPGVRSSSITTAEIRQTADVICEHATRACQAAASRKR
jgi:hypothetical protein